MSDMEKLLAAARAVDAQRPAEAAARLTKALGVTSDPLEVETLLSLRSYASWLVGDWTDMPALIADFRRAQQLRAERTRGSRASDMLAAVAREPGSPRRIAHQEAGCQSRFQPRTSRRIDHRGFRLAVSFPRIH